MRASHLDLPTRYRGNLLAALFIYAIVFVVMPPPLDHYFGKYRGMDGHPWKVLSTQINGTYKSEDYNQASHEAKLTFRRLPPLIGKLSFSQNPYTQVMVLYFVQQLMGIAFTFLLFSWLTELIPNWYQAGLMTTGFLLTHIGSSFTYDLSFFFDGVAFFFLGLAMFSRSVTLFGLALTAALWTDERAFVGIAGVLLFKLVTPVFSERIFTNKYTLATLVVLLVYGAIRGWLTVFGGMNTPFGKGAGVGVDIWANEVNLMPASWILTFKLYWYYLIPLGIYLWRKSVTIALLSGAFIFSALLSTGLVIDIMRSASYLFPFLICGIFCAHQMWTREKTTWVGKFNALWSVVIPNYRKLDVLHLILPLPARILHIFF